MESCVHDAAQEQNLRKKILMFDLDVPEILKQCRASSLSLAEF